MPTRDPYVTLTTGLRDQLIFPHLEHPVPKDMSKAGADRSDDFGKIPSLRDPYRPNKKIERFNKKLEKVKNRGRNASMGMRKYANSIVESTSGKDSFMQLLILKRSAESILSNTS